MVINVYKEKGWTSFDAVAKLRSILKTRKIGHAGTLDPLAEGVLVVLTGEDTKKQTQFMKFKKEYIAEIAFGGETTTYDLEGDIKLSGRIFSVEGAKKELQNILPKYLGRITQKVPPYSAKKVGGTRLYKEARNGNLDLEELPTQNVEIYELEILDAYSKSFGNVDLPVIEVRILCSSGTYIRSLAHDLGKDLGCGALLASLTRTKVGNFYIEESKKVLEI